MYKKICSLAMVLVSVFLINNVAYATVGNENGEIINQNDFSYFEQSAENEIMDGYKLESVKVDILYDDDAFIGNDSISNSGNEIEPNGLVYKIKNVNHTLDEFMFTNEFESDYFCGPCNVSETYTKSTTARANCSVNIGKSTLKAAVGYSFTKKFTVSKKFSTNVAANKYLHLKTYVVYRRTDFDIYKILGNTFVEHTWSGKPVGLAFIQAVYSK